MSRDNTRHGSRSGGSAKGNRGGRSASKGSGGYRGRSGVRHDEHSERDERTERGGYPRHNERDEWDERPRRDERPYRDYERAPYPDRPDYQRPRNTMCPVASRCGGCEWLAMPYEEQLALKQESIEDLFDNFKCEVEPIIGMDDPVRFRNKVQLPFAPGRPDRDGRTTVRWGIFERGTHRIVPCLDCLVEDERARPIIATIADMLPRFNIKPYDEPRATGMLRYVLVRTAMSTGQIMVTLVCSSNHLPSTNTFVDNLLKVHPEITSIVLNINETPHTSVILGAEEKVLYGPGYIEDRLCGCTFRISSSSFYQTNPEQAERLYDLAIDMAGLSPRDRMADAYCGTGTIGIAAAVRTGAHLLGVERNADAIEDARANARANGLTNADFVVGDAGSVFSRMARAGEKLDVVFMDPPRAGSSPAFLANLARLSPRRVVYISCEPRSQHHDLQQLVRSGYRVERIRPVDMFPHTNHVENVVLLSRVEWRPRGGQGTRGNRGPRDGRGARGDREARGRE